VFVKAKRALLLFDKYLFDFTENHIMRIPVIPFFKWLFIYEGIGS